MFQPGRGGADGHAENHSRDLERVIQALGKAPDGPALPAPRCPWSLMHPGDDTPGGAVLPPGDHPHLPGSGAHLRRSHRRLPPAIPVAISGERFGPEALAVLAHYDVEAVDVVANP